MTIRAHFNGTVIVPDEPVDLPVDTALEVEVKRTSGFSPEVAAAMEAARDPADTARRLAALGEFVAHAVAGADIPDEMLRREGSVPAPGAVAGALASHPLCRPNSFTVQ